MDGAETGGVGVAEPEPELLEPPAGGGEPDAGVTAPPPRRRWLPRLAVPVAVVVALAALEVTLLAPAPIPVQVAIVERGRVEETITNSRAGTVEARRRAKLSPESGGRVAALRTALPGLPVTTPVGFVLAAVGVSLATGLVSGVVPAQRAARLDPIEALRAE